MPASLPAMTVLGSRLRQCRQSKGWSQAQLGEKLGWGEANTAAPRISRYERGIHEADMETLQKLSEILEVPIPCFFTPSENTSRIVTLVDSLSETEKEHALKMMEMWLYVKDVTVEQKAR